VLFRSDAIRAVQFDIDNDGTERYWQVPYPSSVSVPRGSPIQLAASLDLSSGAADIGQSALKAIQMAVADFGQIKGFRVQVNVFDSQCGDRFIGYQTAAAIIANTQTAGVLGHTCSWSFQGGLPVYESVGMVTISGSTTFEGLPEYGPQVFNRTTLFDPLADDWLAALQNLPAVKSWNARYKAQYGADPAKYVVLYYDAATLMLQRIKSVSSIQNGALGFNRSALAGAVRGTSNQPGISGAITFDGLGNRVPVCYLLATSANPAAGGSVQAIPSPTCSGGKYYEGTLVKLTPAPAPGFIFSNWSGAINGNAVPVTLLMNGNKSVSANFFVLPPTPFSKNTPAYGAINQPLSLTLSWGASQYATSYQYCIDTSNNNVCNTSWVNVGNTLSAQVSGLSANSSYFWQVRATNAGGSMVANGNPSSGAWWPFSTLPCYTLNTAVSPGGSGSVAVDLGPNCSGGRYIAGTLLHLTAMPAYGKTFSTWSGALAGNTNPATLTMNGSKNVIANFAPTPPGAFSKTAPASGSTNVSRSPQLRWQTSQYATGYLVCIDTSNNATCDTNWVNVGSNLSTTMNGLARNTTYYWQVKASNSGLTIYANGNASSGTWWSFTTRP
jgi:ABC-type branched-subunit amino acid transport system substrate-binding protein